MIIKRLMVSMVIKNDDQKDKRMTIGVMLIVMIKRMTVRVMIKRMIRSMRRILLK